MLGPIDNDFIELEDRRIKIHPREMESLLNLKSLADHKETVSSYAEEYQKLGWVLQAENLQNGIELEVDSGRNPQAWVDCLEETGSSAAKINLGVSTGKRSRLMVLEVTRGRGESILDQYGPWRAECVAFLGDRREQHFYAWDPSSRLEAAAFQDTPELRWFGAGQVVPVPPSYNHEIGETWRWLSPPWETPPQYPSQSLANFLHQHLRREAQARPEASLPEPEAGCLASPHEQLLLALSASQPSVQKYYQGILEAATNLGLEAPEVLQALLWQATRGKARQPSEIRGSLQTWVGEAQDQTDTVTFPGMVPGEWCPDNGLPWSRALPAGSSRRGPEQTGLPGSLQRRMANPPPPGAAIRTPFSCRKIRGE